MLEIYVQLYPCPIALDCELNFLCMCKLGSSVLYIHIVYSVPIMYSVPIDHWDIGHMSTTCSYSQMYLQSIGYMNKVS